MSAYREALLDSVLDRDELVRAHAGSTDVFLPHLARVVAVAARSRDYKEVLDAARPLDRMRGVLHAKSLLPMLGAHYDTHIPLRRSAREVDAEGWELLAPVTKADLAAHRVYRDAQVEELLAKGYHVDAPGRGQLRLPLRRPARVAQLRLPLRGGPLPDLEDLVEMSDAELVALQRRFGRKVSRDRMLSEAVRDELRQLTRARNPDPALLEHALDRAESVVRRELMLDAKAALRDWNLEALGADAGTRLRWVSVLRNDTCDSCNWRHGQRATLDAWEEMGVPGSDELLCDGSCRCEFEEIDMATGRSIPNDAGE